MAYGKGEVNRAGAVIAESKRPATAKEVDQLNCAIEVVEWWRGEHSAPLNAVAANLRSYVAEVSELAVSQRLKRLPTIADKLTRLPTMKLTTMGDIGGVRAVVPDQNAADHVAKRLRDNWSITRFSDYVAAPKADGYRALHLINQHDGRLIEVQIRTPLQDDWANTVEILSRSVAPDLKFGNGPVELRELLTELASIYAELEAGGSSLDAEREKFEEIDALIVTLEEASR
jgi:ppGpp synthetase/RelA/SpoT-type nucleotidyltranferase